MAWRDGRHWIINCSMGGGVLLFPPKGWSAKDPE